MLVGLSFFSGKRPSLRGEPKYVNLNRCLSPRHGCYSIRTLRSAPPAAGTRARKADSVLAGTGGWQSGSTQALARSSYADRWAQNTFFENIRQMRETAEASISPLPGQGQQRDRDSPHSPLRRDSGDVPTQYAPQRSGLRHHLEEDDSWVDDGSMIVMEPRNRPPPEGRFSRPLQLDL